MNNILENTTGEVAPLPTPSEIGAAPSADHQIKTYTSLEQLGLSDTDGMSKTDLKANLLAIHQAMPIRSMLWFYTPYTSNFANSLKAQLATDVNWNVNVYWYVRIEKVENRTLYVNVACTYHSEGQEYAFYELCSILSYLADGTTNLAPFTFARHKNGFLPLIGGTLKGAVIFNNSNAFSMIGKQRIINGVDHWLNMGVGGTGAAVIEHWIGNPANGSSSTLDGRFEVFTDKLLFKKSSTESGCEIFGEHNKPTGSYTGNGSATKRTINIGGIGSTLVIEANPYMGIVTAAGAIVSNGSTVKALSKDKMSFINGALTMVTNDSYVNQSGGTYSYIVA